MRLTKLRHQRVGDVGRKVGVTVTELESAKVAGVSPLEADEVIYSPGTYIRPRVGLGDAPATSKMEHHSSWCYVPEGELEPNPETVSLIRSKHRMAASVGLRATLLFERAGAQRDMGVLDECLEFYHPDVHMTWSGNGVTVRTHGRAELRRVLLESMSDNRRYRHLNPEVMLDEPDRAVVRTTLLTLQGDHPLVAGLVDWTTVLREGLIAESHGAESPLKNQPIWAPLGSTYSVGAEILSPWGETQLLVRLYDGRPLELPAPEELDDAWDVGDQVMVFLENETVLGWYMPDKQLGIDLSDPGDAE